MVSLSQSKNGRGKYCSRKCAAIGKTGVSRLDMLGNNFGLNNIAWNKGIRICLNSGRTHIKKGNIPHNKGVVGVRKASKETKLKQSLAQKGENGSNWQGGKSFEGYPMKFDRWLREDIRDRDGRMCRECNSMEIDLVEKLQVHHIDYNKQNNDPGNLLSLCRSCHAKTNFNREDWITHFQFNSAYRIEAI